MNDITPRSVQANLRPPEVVIQSFVKLCFEYTHSLASEIYFKCNSSLKIQECFNEGVFLS